MATLEQPRTRPEKKRIKEEEEEEHVDDDSQLENRIRDLKEYFEEAKPTAEETTVDPPIEQTETIIDPSVEQHVEVNEPIVDSLDETEVERPIETIVNPTTETNVENSQEIINDPSAFLYPRLSLSFWSPATAPLSIIDGENLLNIPDPYSIENFNPSALQNELRETFLPFINITDEDFLSEQESFITSNPRVRSSMTKDEHGETTTTNDDDDEFYFLISSLYDIRTKIDQLTNEYDVLQRKIAFLLPHVWSFSSEKIEAGAYCGDNVYLKRSILYEQANFDRNLAKEIEDTLKQLRTIIYQQYVALKYDTLWFKMKIDTYISNLLSSNRVTKKLLHTIEILFNFQRYRTRDQLFYTYTRQLLKQTIDLVYRCGNYNETLFIISHVLRCPPGIHQWATTFVRLLLPNSFDQLCSPSYIRYVAHFLATLLFPIKNRDVFLQNWLGENGETIPQLTSLTTLKTSQQQQQQQQWMLIDADGQERAALLRWDTLNEDDLIAILNQFNLNYLMKVLFNLNDQTKSNDERRIYSYENTVRTLAILDLFVEILCRGFDTYADCQYKNFHKHIGKMIRDCVHVCRYHVDGIVQFLNQDDRIRLRDHYFAYIYRSVENIIRLCRNVRWSLLSLFALFDLPISLQNRLLHLICSIPDGESVTVETSAAVDQMLNSATPSEILSLLKVLHNLGQTGDESGQISNVIFYITCLHPISREYSLRDGRSILAHFASLRPALISHLLVLASSHLDAVGKNLFGLFHSLPMDIWVPTDHDLSILEQWLNDISSTSIDFQLALDLIDTMNWKDLPDKTQLCIPYSIHCEMSLILLKLHLKYCDKISSSKENQQALQNFQRRTSINLDQWIWTSILRLQLNQSCLSVDAFIDSMSQEHVSNLNSNLRHFTTENGTTDEMINEIRRSIDQFHNPIALYISFGLDQPGVSATGFFERGIDYFCQLVQNGKYNGAIRVLHDMSGILVRSVDYLIEHAPFMNTLKNLLDVADNSQSLLKTASSYLIQQRPSDETSNAKLLTAALLDLLIWLEDNPKFRRLILLLWFKLLTAIKDWNKDTSILFVLDNLLAHSFVHDVMNEEVTNHLFDLAVSALNPRQNPQVVRSGLLSWLPLPSAVTSNQTYWSSLSIDSSLLARYPIVSYYFLNAENSFEIEQNVLSEFKAELELNSTGKVDQIWKKVIQQRHFPFIPLTSLSIYRWGTMACEMPVDHPFLPLVWEKFFTIYLSKHENCLHRVGHRLFESTSQTTFLKQMKRSLCQASEHYGSLTNSPAYTNHLSAFYRSLSLWIDEPRLHDPQLNILSLPQQYDNERLAHLFDTTYRIGDIKWLEVVDLRQLYENLVKFTNEFWSKKRSNHEQTSRTTTNSIRPKMTSSDKLVDLVNNSQRPSTTMKVVQSNSETLLTLNPASLPKDFTELRDLFERELNKIILWLKSHCQRHQKQIELDQILMGLLPILWKNEFQEQSIQASCQNVLNPVHQCTRPAYIIVRYKSKQQCQNANQRLESILNEHKQLLTEACRSCDTDICHSIDILNQTVQHLTRQLSSPLTQGNQSLAIIDTGTQLFYSLLLVYNDQYDEFMQPIAEQLNSNFDTLGEIFVKSNLRQPQIILEYVVLNKPNISRLINYFNPNSLFQSEKFIDIYSKLSKMFTFFENTPFLLQMFRKFNVKQWFGNVSNPTQRIKFIETLFQHFRSMVENFSLAAKRENPPGYDELPLIEQTSQLFDIATGHMIQILNYSYPSQIAFLFRHLIETMKILRRKQKLIQQQNTSLVPLEFQQSIERGLLPSKVLSEFLDQLHYLENTSNITLGKQQIDEMLNWLTNFVLQQTDENQEKRLVQLYQIWRPCINELTRIYTVMMILNIEKSRNVHHWKINSTFEDIFRLYQPFIDPTMSCFALTEWKTIIDYQGDMLTRMIKTFLQLNEKFYEFIKDSFHYQQEFFQCVFQFWYKIVKCLITNEFVHPILDIYHQYLSQLSWSNYRLTVESLLIFDELINANNAENIPSTSLYKFIITILSSIDVHEWMRTNEQTLVPTYFRLLINLFLSPQAKYNELNLVFDVETSVVITVRSQNRLDQRSRIFLSLNENDHNDQLSRLANQCETIRWNFLDFQLYDEILQTILPKLDQDFLLAARASIEGYLNRILRCAAEFSSTSSSKRLSYLKLVEQCLINARIHHDKDEFRLALINLLNDIESLSIQGKIGVDDELENLLGELIRFLNVQSFGQTILNSYQNYLLDWIRHSQSSVMMLPFFAVVCRTLKDRRRKILFFEIILFIYFIYDRRAQWTKIFEIFQRNEDFENAKIDDYLQLCCESNAFFTFYLFSENELISMKNVTHEQILDREFRFVEKLIDLLTNGKIRIIHGEEERVLLLMLKIHQIILHQLEFGRGTDVLLTRLIRNYAVWLINLGTDNKEYAYAGLFSLIGIGKKAQYSLRFRLFVKLLGTMQLQQLTDEPIRIRVDSNDRQPDLSLSSNAVLKQQLSNVTLAANATTHEYLDLKNEIIFCNSEFLLKADVTFFQISSLIEYLCVHLFADLPYLTISSRQNS